MHISHINCKLKILPQTLSKSVEGEFSREIAVPCGESVNANAKKNIVMEVLFYMTLRVTLKIKYFLKNTGLCNALKLYVVFGTA